MLILQVLFSALLALGGGAQVKNSGGAVAISGAQVISGPAVVAAPMAKAF